MEYRLIAKYYAIIMQLRRGNLCYDLNLGVSSLQEARFLSIIHTADFRTDNELAYGGLFGLTPNNVVMYDYIEF